MRNKKLFTLIEILVVSVIFSFVMVIILSFYFKTLDIKVQTLARQDLMKSSYFIFEKLNILMKDYKIDYEEYFNRRVVGCDNTAGTNFSWDVGDNGYCDRFTAYGNGNPLISDQEYMIHHIYWCSSESGDNQLVIQTDAGNLEAGSGCWAEISNVDGIYWQSFGEYAKQFWDVKDDADGTGGVVGDDDDVDLGNGPIAIADNTNVKELYLISKDGKKRLFIRRALIESGDYDKNGLVSDREKLYTLQMLRLKGFDAGKYHNFDNIDEGTYDGLIDTWACDWSEGFSCKGNDIGGVYTNYKLPQDVNDGWVNIFPSNITISDWNLVIYPSKDPNLAWAVDEQQINPYIKMKIKTKLYGKNRRLKISPATLSGYQMSLETVFNIKTYY